MAVVYSYVRFSSKRQEHGDSLRRQREAGERWIKENGHKKGRLTLEDAGVSAFRGKNRHEGALKRFLDEVAAGTVRPGSILLVENLDRLSREGVYKALSLFGEILESGVEIVVLEPHEQRYTKESSTDLVGLLIPLINFHLAHLESLKKSNRVKAAWQEKRRKGTEGQKFNKRCPSWLEWDDVLVGFRLREGWEAIRYIYEKTAEGYGQVKILSMLQKKFAPLGTSGNWNSSFINSVLSDRSVLGELQPKELNEDGQRVPAGPPITDYYPAVIDEVLWHEAQRSKASRRKQKGRKSDFINLFTGLMFSAHDLSQMHVSSSPSSSGERIRRLVSYKHKRKAADAWPVSIEYDRVERAILECLVEIPKDELRPRKDRSELDNLEHEFRGLNLRRKELREKLADPKFAGVDSLSFAALDVESRLKVVGEEVARLRQDIRTGDPLEKATNVLGLLDKAKDKHEREHLRLKLKSLMPEIVESIWIKAEKYRSKSVAVVQINLRNGGMKHIQVLPDFHTGLTRFVTDRADVHSDTTYVPKGRNEVLDIRDKVGFHIWSAKKIMELSDQCQVDVPKTRPKDIGAAANIWLAAKKNAVGTDSFRTIPAAIRRMADSLCRETLLEDFDRRLWEKWKRDLRKRIKSGELQLKTARVNYNRSKEYLRWLIDQGYVEEWTGWQTSAAKVIK